MLTRWDGGGATVGELGRSLVSSVHVRPTHFASHPDKKSLFERSETELQRFADMGVIA